MEDDFDTITQLIKDFFPFAQKKMGFKKPPRIFLNKDPQNLDDPMAPTGYYDPETCSIVVYIVNRQPKDILRTLAHEMIHHCQHERGEFNSNNLKAEEGYAQKDPHLRDMEEEAYGLGGLIVRDWEDQKKLQDLKESSKIHKIEWRNIMSEGIEEKRQKILNNMDDNNTTKAHWIKRSGKLFDTLVSKIKKSKVEKEDNNNEPK